MGKQFADLEPEKFIRKDPRAFVGPTGKIRYAEFTKEEMDQRTLEEIFLTLMVDGFSSEREIKDFAYDEEYVVFFQTVEA